MRNKSISTVLNPLIKGKNWWKGCVIYQVYPRSFQDSNGDGIGDIKGIISRLPYVADLGVDAVWVSPFFTSPMKDFGYDVTDYRNIDSIFGSIDDFDELLNETHKKGLRLIIDLVLSHSSDQHPWFRESRSSLDNTKADWYVWANAKSDGTPPNNWLSIFGGSAWQWSTDRKQYYLHNFLSSQPDFNLHNLDVQDALLDIARFWLDKGVDGFRLDTINFYFHDKLLRDNPPLATEKRNSSIAPQENVYNYQDHIYSKNQPENINFLKRLRKLLEQYSERTLLGEIGDASRGLEIMGEYTQGDDRVHMCYAFEFLESRVPTAEWIQFVFEKINQHVKTGWPCWAFSNHDVKRHKSRWLLTEQALKTYACLLLCLRGSACIYQGEELGLEEADIAFADLKDPYGIEFWPKFKGRDGCRTPIAWEYDKPMGGFTTGKPWLPISDAHLAKCAMQQISDQTSIYHFYKKVIALRHRYAAIGDGDLVDLCVDNNMLSFIRKNHNTKIFFCFNLGKNQAKFNLPNLSEGKWRPLDILLDGMIHPDSQNLKAWQYSITIKN